MREYEVTVIIQPNLEEEARSALIERVTSWLTLSEDEADKPVMHLWGERRLAYPIKKFDTGYYVHFEAKLSPQENVNIERNMQYNEEIIRYLIVRKEQ